MVDLALNINFQELKKANALPLIKKGINKESIVLFNNDVFSIATRDEVVQSQIELLQNYSSIFLSASIHTDNDNYISKLERLFSAFLNSEDTILCQSGYIANLSLLQAIVQDSTTNVFVDEEAHISLYDGLLLKKGKPHIFRHNDVHALNDLLKSNNHGLIIVDSIYSTDGSIAPLKKITELSKKYGCQLLVDESHSIGINGSMGQGKVVELRLEDEVNFRTASLSKAFAGRAGLITCKKEFKEFIKHSCSSMVCSTSILPIDTASLATTLKLMNTLSSQRKRLSEITKFVRKTLSEHNYKIKGTEHLICIEFDTYSKTILLSNWLEANNIFGALYFPPAMPKHRSMIRLTLNSTLTDDNIKKLVDALIKFRETTT